MKAKRVAESLTEQVHIVMPSHISGTDRLFGGQLLAWIDEVAAVTAIRHCENNVTTVAIDNLQFKAGVFINNLLVLIGRVTYVGRTSMEIRVDTYVEDQLSGSRKAVNRAYFVMVALDKNENPTEVPRLILETESEKGEWEAGMRRKQLRTERRREGF
ncbi:MAG: acyl-CoA thioesterase [Bacillota bacterium]|jgi:acyl-CoA hydrolase|nr:acyl-CoA thioesterase [Bacillota bacterium]